VRDGAGTRPLPARSSDRWNAGLREDGGLEIYRRQQDDDSVNEHSSRGGEEYIQLPGNFLESERFSTIAIEREGAKMRQRKFTFLLVALLVALGLLFAGGEARATNYPTFNYSVALKGFVADPDGAGGTYTYLFDGSYPGATSINVVEFEIPMTLPGITGINLGPDPVPPATTTSGTGFVEVSVYKDSGAIPPAFTTTTPVTATTSIFGAGKGDPVLRLGTEDKRYRVLKVFSTTFPFKFWLTLKIKGQTLPTDKQLGSGTEVVLMATNNLTTDWGVVDTPVVVDKLVGNVKLQIGTDPATGFPCPNPVEVGTCTCLKWEAPNASFAFISNIDAGDGPVNPNPPPSLLPVLVCPSQESTNYVLTAIQADGRSFQDNVLVTLKPNAFTPSSTFSNVEITGAFLQFTKSGLSGCITKVSTCSDASFLECNEIPPETTIGGETVLSCSPSAGGGCQECIVVTKGSPTCSNILTANGNFSSCACKTTEYWLYDTDGPNADTSNTKIYWPTRGVWSPTRKTANVAECSTTAPTGTPPAITITTGTRQGTYLRDPLAP
jgi:hypothetical protein